ncbi:hypothetical protein FHR84_000708 [Actinopolyspora biskrensis]|uniref:Uncharacterized protein n=1 Tax=Actinopolyspora biskrensis TaxID=1470178 RepID=A0A852YQ56_9ACTN|nr:hypothetical protein [Actinopolyspora biskrensis]
MPAETPRPEAMSGNRPASTNSEVPVAKTDTASRDSARGIRGLRDEESNEQTTSRHRGQHPTMRAADPTGESGRDANEEPSGSGG